MSDEYDAFGRKKDEAGLGDLGWGSSGDPAAKPHPAPAPPASPNAPIVTAGTTRPQTEFQTVTPVTTGLGRPRRNPLIFFIQFAVIAGIGLAIYFAVAAGNDAADKARKTIDSFTNPGGGSSGGGSKSGGDDTVPEQVSSRKLFTASGFRAALKVLEKEQPGKISNFSMRRDRIDIQVIRGGKTHIVDFPADAEVPDELTTSTATGNIQTFNYEEINVAAPERLMKAANSRLNQSPADVDYFVAQKYTGTMQWGIYYKGGSPIAQGDSRGRYTRKIA
ncbi:MAG: hypothetical protein QOI80_1425 [Solirubrobacteraceae bacterium]|jgi:hypothetical protein|nr:hypothetical protein [Solirubrobacteraceae bacterium]